MIGCEGTEGGDGEDGLNILVLTEIEPTGSNCANGGTKVSFGYDNDADGVLSSSEVSTSTYVCNGEDGDDGNDGNDGNAGVANINVQVLPLMASDWSFIDTDGDGVGYISATFANEDLTLDIVNNGMVIIEFSRTNNPPEYMNFPIIFYDGGILGVDWILDSWFTYTVGEVTVSWDASNNPTASVWLSASAIYSGYYKITTILPD